MRGNLRTFVTFLRYREKTAGDAGGWKDRGLTEVSLTDTFEEIIYQIEGEDLEQAGIF